MNRPSLLIALIFACGFASRAFAASVRTEQWHFAEFFGRGAGKMLTNPVGDPHELKNLADKPSMPTW